MDTGNGAFEGGRERAPEGHLLFAYGSLLLTTGIEAVDAVMRETGISLGRGYIHGRLYDLDDYPGAVPAEPSQGGDEDALKVWGRLIRLRDPQTFFSVIDDYEGFLPGDPAGSEFVRAAATIFLPESGRALSGQVYYYNQPTDGRAPIPSGDYLAHRRARGRGSQGRTGI